jgi:D-tyrosyl-tRNA(Tyr) deacylase
MRVVLQRVARASVRVGGRTVGSIGRGLLLLVGFNGTDGEDEIDWMARKIVGLRVFNDHDSKMNLSVEEVGGDLLVVSQFTLYGDVRKGRRPSFVDAADPALAEPLYQRFSARLRDLFKGSVEEGEFGAMMDVELVNDGPVTLVIDRDRE